MIGKVKGREAVCGFDQYRGTGHLLGLEVTTIPVTIRTELI